MKIAMDGCVTRDCDLFEKGGACSEPLGDFLEEQGFESVWKGFLEQHSTAEALKSAFHGWFDAFRTMKLFHYLAEREYPRAEPEEILGSFPEAWGEAGFSMSERLEFLRKEQS
jgi:hypothetical protein